MSVPPGPVRIVVVGGGVTGLAAAWEATGLGAQVTLLEASDRFGGLVRTTEIHVDGDVLRIDEGADAFLARVPDAVDLCHELGLGEELVSPASGRAFVWVDGDLRPLPGRHTLGVPLDPEDPATRALLGEAGVQQLRDDLGRIGPGLDGDTSIGAFVGDRLGRPVVDRIVGPLVGGISAGDVDRLSLESVAPQLAEAARRGDSLLGALRRAAGASSDDRPVFAGLRDGTGRLVDTLVEQLRARGADLRTGRPVERIGARDGSVTVHGPDDVVTADAVVVATPARHAAGIVSDLSGTAADELRAIPTTTVVLVTFVLDAADVPGPLDGSGFLVPRDAGLLLTAASWGSSKWAHWDDGRHVVLRVSAGHAGDTEVDRRTDAEVTERLLDDLRTTMGISAPPRATRVSRWTDAFPQYEVGHAQRVLRIEEALGRDAPGVRVAGMCYRGVGIPASIRSGRTAVRSLLRLD